MSKSIKKNYILNTTYQVFVLITPFITTPYLARVLGADLLGIESFISSVASYFVMFAGLGISSYIGRQIAYFKNDKHSISLYFFETRFLQLILSFFILCIYLFFTFKQQNRVLYLIYSVQIVTLIFNIDFLFYAVENFESLFFRNILFRIIDVLFILFFVKDRSCLGIYIFGKIIISFIGYLSLWIGLNKYIEFVKFSEIRVFRNFKVILELFIPTISTQIYQTVDKIMIGIITNDNFQNGFYELSIKLPKILLTLIVSLCTVMTPRIANYYKAQRHKEINEYMNRSFNFVWLIASPLAFGLVAISKNFVPWFFGSGYDEIIKLTNILGFLIIPMGLSTIMGVQYLIATGRQKEYNMTIIIGMVINCILNSILIFNYGSLGAAFASLIAETLITLLQFYIIKSEISIKHILKMSKNYILSSVIMYCIIKYYASVLASTFVSSIILVLVGATIYFTLLFLLRDKFFNNNIIYICSEIRSKFKK